MHVETSLLNMKHINMKHNLRFLNIKKLQIIDAIARTGSFSQAAEDLNCVQPNISHRVKDLEERLGVTLINRGSRRASLTSTGMVLNGYAERLLYLTNEAERAVLESVDKGGYLNLGSMETTAAIRLSPILVQFHNQFPKVNISLVTGPTKRSIKGVFNYELDAAFVAGEVKHKDIVSEHVFTEELVLVRPKGIDIDDAETITGQTLIVFHEGCTYRNLSERWADDKGLVVSAKMQFGSLDSILGLIAAGMGMTLLPRSVVESKIYRATYGDYISVEKIADKFATIKTHFIRHRDTFLTKPMKALLGMVEDGGKTG